MSTDSSSSSTVMEIDLVTPILTLPSTALSRAEIMKECTERLATDEKNIQLYRVRRIRSSDKVLKGRIGCSVRRRGGTTGQSVSRGTKSESRGMERP